jgi:hypothetical protein
MALRAVSAAFDSLMLFEPCSSEPLTKTAVPA